MSQPMLQLVQMDEVVAPVPQPVKNWATGHDVQFYDSEEYLGTTVAAFLAEGIRAGQPVVVIATEAHGRLFRERLQLAGIRLETLVEGRDFVWLDARDTLASFMEGDLPNAELFNLTVGAVFDRLMANGRGYVVTRAYGEMVDVLWRQGKIDGAIELEQLWNRLAQKYAFALLCAYSMGNFVKETSGTDFARICAAHNHVTPSEAYSTLNDADRLREIARLQQRSRALEAEIEYRKEVEAALLDVIAHRRRMEDVIRRSERELRDVLENAPIAMHWVDATGRITWANRQELALLGYSSREYVGRDISDFHLDAGRAHDLLRRLASGETIRDFHATLRCKDGSFKRVLISSNVRWKDGMFDHTRCFTREIGTLNVA